MFPPAVSVVPIFILASKLNLTDTFPVLIVPYAAFGLPMVIWMLRSFIKQIPHEIEEAAMVDGASQAAILRHIVLPLLMPGIVAASLLERHAGLERVPVRPDAHPLGRPRPRRSASANSPTCTAPNGAA